MYVNDSVWYLAGDSENNDACSVSVANIRYADVECLVYSRRQRCVW